jgi:hypothetical protein
VKRVSIGKIFLTVALLSSATVALLEATSLVARPSFKVGDKVQFKREDSQFNEFGPILSRLFFYFDDGAPLGGKFDDILQFSRCASASDVYFCTDEKLAVGLRLPYKLGQKVEKPSYPFEPIDEKTIGSDEVERLIRNNSTFAIMFDRNKEQYIYVHITDFAFMLKFEAGIEPYVTVSPDYIEKRDFTRDSTKKQ